MAYRERQKISQMTPKGSDLEATDLVEVSVLQSGSYVTKSITGQEIINAASGGGDLTVGTTPIISGTDTRVFFQQGGVLQQDANFTFDNTLKRLTLKAVGTAATDIPLSIRNSAGTGLLFQATGDGKHSFNMSPNTNFALSIDQTNQNGGISVYSSGQTIFNVAKIAGSIGYMGVLNNGNYSFFTGNSSYFNHSLVVGGNSLSPGARLDVRAQGALSTDIAFRVRNSADSGNLFDVQGDGVANVRTRMNCGFSGMTSTGGALFVYAGNNNDYVSRFYNTIGNSFLNIRTTGNGCQMELGNASGSVGLTLNGIYSNAITLADSRNIVFGTGGGTKIASATNEKFAFWNATPIVQPTTAVTSATIVHNAGGTAIKTDDTFDGYTLGQIVKALRNTGLLA